jgi:molybdopterin converting factor small subunit
MEFSNETVYFLIGVFIVATVLIYNVKKDKKEMSMQTDVQTVDTLLAELEKLKNRCEALEMKLNVEVHNNNRSLKELNRAQGLMSDSSRQNDSFATQQLGTSSD